MPSRPSPCFLLLALAGAATTAATGCVRLAADVVAGVAVTGVVLSTQEPPRVVVVQEVPPPVPARVDGTPPPPGFDAEGARAAIESVDLAACWVPGSTHGSGVARITFNPAGDVGLVEVVNPVEGATLDTGCASRRFNELRMTPFDGAPISVTGRIFVG
jgi:hypothetical protein